LIPGKVGAWACKVHSKFLPLGSPELVLAEKLWPSSNETIAKRLFEEISEVEEALMERCHQLLGQAKTIRVLTTGHTCCQQHYLPQHTISSRCVAQQFSTAFFE
jgi:hypothetical protein